MRVRKALLATSIPTGKEQALFLLSQDPFSLQGGKALAGDQEPGTKCTSLGFQVPLVSLKPSSKAAELLNPLAVLVVPTEVE